MTKQIKKKLEFGEARIDASNVKSADKKYKQLNPQHINKPYLIEPEEYDDPAKLKRRIDKMKEISDKQKSSIF